MLSRFPMAVRAACLRFSPRQSGLADHETTLSGLHLRVLYHSDKISDSWSQKVRWEAQNQQWGVSVRAGVLYTVSSPYSQTRVQILPEIYDERSGNVMSPHPSFWKHKFMEKMSPVCTPKIFWWYTTQKQQRAAAWSCLSVFCLLYRVHKTGYV